MSNYPPGVTGNEFEIVGSDYEKELDDQCPKCYHYNSLIEYGYRSQWWILCNECDYHKDLECEHQWSTIDLESGSSIRYC